jgi:hypothetical protein
VQSRIVSTLDDLQIGLDAVKRLQSETAAELDAILPAMLDRAFKGELVWPACNQLHKQANYVSIAAHESSHPRLMHGPTAEVIPGHFFRRGPGLPP